MPTPAPGAAQALMLSGPLANLAANVLRAQAFVVGRRIFLSREAARAIAGRTPEGLALLTHELAHVEQYRRYGVAGFLGRYVLGYLAGRVRGNSHAQAYAAIHFEREAERFAQASLSPAGSPGGLPRDA